MWKLIVKNLWARRRRNGWLLAELILIGIICWVVFDPVVVLTHDRRIPLGYDADRLCLVSLGGLQPNAPGYDTRWRAWRPSSRSAFPTPMATAAPV